ncbi:hypothetical protein [Tumebacillus lipolyticus]|uniref:Uncharacterized protein n=1 Tax=Tumebacillus lipolyticus TaxID=1280370 RepID=A0ABW5A385_9BACL
MQSSWGYGLYLLLYTIFWSALSVIAYRILVLDGILQVQTGHYFFTTGLLLLVCGAVRALSPVVRQTKESCPIVGSFYLTGILLILYANLA